MPQTFTRREYLILLDGIAGGILVAKFISVFFGSIGLGVAWSVAILIVFIVAVTRARWK